jgi:nicotinamide mononucleotide adenylyltransferase
MQNILAEGNRKTDGWAMFIGRWQPWHDGHRWLIDQQLNQGKKVLLCVRDVKQDENNPWSAWEIMMMLSDKLMDLVEDNKLRIIMIPDIESINFGRGVGYDVIEHIPPPEIGEISATKIREDAKRNKNS